MSKKVRDGLIKYYHDNGNIEFKGMFENDLQHGPFKIFYENGQIHQEGNYVHGVPNGPYKIYYKTGSIKNEGNTVYGEHDGHILTYHENGRIMMRNIYNVGECIESKRYIWDFGKLIKEETYKDDKLISKKEY